MSLGGFDSQGIDSATALDSSRSLAVIPDIGNITATRLSETEYLVVAKPIDPATDAQTSLYLSALGFKSTDTDTPALEPFLKYLIAPYSINASLVYGNGVGGGGLASVGDIVLDNSPAEFGEPGPLDDIARYRWNGASVEVYVGNTGDTFAEFVSIYKGEVEYLEWDEDSVTLKLRDIQSVYGQRIQRDLYAPSMEPYFLFDGATWADGGDNLDAGTGDLALAARFKTSTLQDAAIIGKRSGISPYQYLTFDGTADYVDHGNNLNQTTGSFSLVTRFRSSSAGTVFLMGKKNAATTSAGYALYCTSTQVACLLADGTNSVNDQHTVTWADGNWHTLAAIIDQTNNLLTVIFDGTAYTPVSISSLGSLSNTGSFRFGRTADNSNDFTGDIERGVFWTSAVSGSTIASALAADLNADTGTASNAWAIDEGSGATLNDLVSTVDGTITGATWGVDSAPGYLIYTDSSGDIHALVDDGTNQTTASKASSGYNDGAWHTVALRLDTTANELTIVFDGVESTASSTSAVGSLNNSDAFRIAAGSGGGDQFTGDVERAAAWIGSATTTTDLADFFAASVTDIDLGWTGATSVWPFTENLGNTIGDSESTNTLTINSSGTGTLVWSGYQLGQPGIEGMPKPLALGRCFDCAPTCLDPIKLVYQVHDGEISSFDAVKDQGNPKTSETYAGKDFWTDESGPTAGYYWGDTTTGLVRLGSENAGALAIDVHGAKRSWDSTYVETGFEIIEMAARDYLGVDSANINSTDLATAAAAAPQVIGIFISSGESPTGSDVFNRCISPFQGYWTVPRDAKLNGGLVRVPSTVGLTLEEADIVLNSLQRIQFGEVAWRQRLGYYHRNTVLALTDTASALDLIDRQALGREWEFVSSSDATIKSSTNYPRAADVTVYTDLVDKSDAQAEADRRLALHAAPMELYTVELTSGLFGYWLGDSVELTINRYGLQTTRRYMVVGIEENVLSDRVVLTLWGQALEAKILQPSAITGTASVTDPTVTIV